MARVNDFADPEYDKKLAEYQALKRRMREEGKLTSNSGSSQRSDSKSDPRIKRY